MRARSWPACRLRIERATASTSTPTAGRQARGTTSSGPVEAERSLPDGRARDALRPCPRAGPVFDGAGQAGLGYTPIPGVAVPLLPTRALARRHRRGRSAARWRSGGGLWASRRCPPDLDHRPGSLRHGGCGTKDRARRLAGAPGRAAGPRDDKACRTPSNRARSSMASASKSGCIGAAWPCCGGSRIRSATAGR